MWLDPSLITKKAELFIDVNAQFGAAYGDVLSWTPGYEPGLGEQKNTVVQKVDVPRLENLLKQLIDRPQNPVSGKPLP